KRAHRILDIGTGTGVIALMLAQRFPEAIVEAIDIDQGAVDCAADNYRNSPFADRLSVQYTEIGEFGSKHRFNLIVSNPPFFLNSLKNPGEKKSLSRHGSVESFMQLFRKAEQLLNALGSYQIMWLLGSRAQNISMGIHGYHSLHPECRISSFPQGERCRTISSFKAGPDSGYYSKDDFPNH